MEKNFISTLILVCLAQGWTSQFLDEFNLY